MNSLGKLPSSQHARKPRSNGRGTRIAVAVMLAFVLAVGLIGCKENAPAPSGNSTDARTLMAEAMTHFHARSTELLGPERERLLNEAAQRYNELLKRFPLETNLCAQALRALGSIHATQGKTNEAVKLYAAVGEKYPSQDWEVLQAWKAAGDLRWEEHEREDAKKFYSKIVERFGKMDAPQIIQQVVRGSKARMTE